MRVVFILHCGMWSNRRAFHLCFPLMSFKFLLRRWLIHAGHFAARIIQEHYGAILRAALAKVEHIAERTRDAIERAAPDTLATEKCIFDKPDDRRLIGHR